MQNLLIENGVLVKVLNKRITSVEIPNSVTTICDRAFKGCNSLVSIEIPSNVTTLGKEAFMNCSKLSKVIFNVDVDATGQESCGIDSIKTKTFYGCSSLTEIKIPSSVKKIYPSAFGCRYDSPSNLKVLRIGKGAVKLSFSIVNPLLNLEEVFVDKDDMFTQPELMEFVIKTSIKNLDYYDKETIVTWLTKNNKILPSLYLSNDLKVIEFLCDNNFFKYEEILKKLEDENLSDESRLYLLNVCNNISTEIKQEYETKMIRKEKVDLGLEEATLKDMKNEWNCSKKNNQIIFGKYIGDEETIVIPSSVDGISSYLFKTQLVNKTVKKIIFSKGIKELYLEKKEHYSIFGNFNLLEYIYFPNTFEVLDIGDSSNLYGYRDDVDIITSDENNNEIDMLIIDKTLVCVSKKAEKIVVPNNVTSIAEYTFSHSSSLISVEIPNSVTSIGKSSFSHCFSLTNITIPNSVTSIGRGAFANCSKLESIEIPNGVTTIEESTFYGCDSLTTIKLPNSLVRIEAKAFEHCKKLKNIELHKDNSHFTLENGNLYNKDLTEVIIRTNYL